MMNKKMYHIIMCGGIGSRFWPMSTTNMPKQFLKLIDEKSLLRLTVDRLLKIALPEEIIIVTSQKYEKNINLEIPEIPKKNILFESTPKNTAPAIYFALKFIEILNKDAIVGVYPSDHHIGDTKIFIQNINKIRKFIINNNKIICTIGIKPNYPSTSYGYIKCGDVNKKEIFKVISFKEKPTIKKAKEFLKSKEFVWNSGMFFFNVSSMITEINTYVPELKKLYSKAHYTKDNISSIVHKIWDKMPKISIDYAVMEKTANAYCIKSDFGWSDIGTWDSIYNLSTKNKDGNAYKGKVVSHDAENNLIVSDSDLVSIVGLNNIAVINHKGKTLVMDLSKSEEVRYIIDKLDNKDK